jgi:ribosomal protein S18 acetylase RimI-like enzyme
VSATTVGGGGDPAPIAIRAATDRDAGDAIELWTEGYVSEGEGGRVTPYSAAEFLDTAQRASVFVAEGISPATHGGGLRRARSQAASDQSGSAVVGIVALLAPNAPGRAVACDGEAELSRLAVSAAVRRRGIGRALVTRCEEVARREGWEAIALWSRRYQVAAHRLYESCGYRRAPSRDSVDETGHERLVFRLGLGDEPPTRPWQRLPE